MTGTFAAGMPSYHRAGWPAILPVPAQTKTPPPTGYTGAGGKDTDALTLARWAANGYTNYSVALRMPEGVIGIDVDHYDKGTVAKRGADDLARHEQRWGPLPATWCSTARGSDTGPGLSRILFYRVPPGRYATKLGEAIEVIQRHHRYAVVAPSDHPSVGARYRWYGPDGLPSDDVPAPDGLPELPAAWVAGLAEGATEAGPAPSDHASGAGMLAQLQADSREPCAYIANAALTGADELAASDAGCRHDTATAAVHRLIQLGSEGHPGAGTALGELRAAWERLTAGEGREHEFDAMALSSARKAVTQIGSVQVPRDPCSMFGSFTVPAPAPADDRDSGEDATPVILPVAATTPYNWRHVIGTGLFDPDAGLDHTLGTAVLQRVWPMLRYASDSGTWLQRGPAQWEEHGALARRAIAEVAELMPKGDTTKPVKGEEPTAAQRRAARRARLMTNAGASAVAAMMTAQVQGGWHLCAVRLGECDSDPAVLWAGGMAYDLSASGDGPAWAAIDPATVHLRSAAVTPTLTPTPGWDRFLAAVWPDERVRAWALRVLSIATTGYPDAALPILLGPAGTGKTSVIALLMSVLGSYAHAANVKLLSGESSHDSIVYALKGRRLSFIDEGPRDGKWAQERLKQLSGGGALTANAMNANPITFAPTHTLVLTTNTEPQLTDEAVRRRVRLIPCEGDPAEVLAARRALADPAVWTAEAPGVLAALMAHAAQWLADPSSALTSAAPASMRGRMDAIATEQDVVAGWLEDECEPHAEGSRARPLFEAFVAWCRSGNIAPARILNDTKWGRELTLRGYPSEHRRDGKYRPLRLRTDAGPGLPVPPPVSRSTTVTPDRSQTGGNAASAEPQAGTGPHGGAPKTENKAKTAASAEAVNVNMQSGASVSDQLLPVGDGSVPSPRVLPVTDGNPSSTPLSSSSVTSVTSSLSTKRDNKEDIEHNIYSSKQVTEIYKGLEVSGHPSQLISGGGSDLHVTGSAKDPHRKKSGHKPSQGGFGPDPADLAAHLRAAAAAGGTTLPDAHRTPPSEPAPAPEPVLPARRGKLTESEKAERARIRQEVTLLRQEEAKATKAAAALAAKAAEVARLAGPLIELPHVALRGSEPRTAELAEAAELVHRAIARSGALTVDTEGNGYPLGHRHYALSTVQLGDAFEGATFDAADPWHMLVVRDLLAAAPMLHAHNAPADLVPLAAAGAIDWRGAWDRMYDTGILAKLSDPTSTDNEEGLKRLAPAVLGSAAVSPAATAARGALWKAAGWLTDVKISTPPERNGWAQVDKRCATMATYALADVFDTAPLAARLPAPAPALLERERRVQRLCARVSLDGLRIDGNHVQTLLASHTAAREPLGVRLRELGIDNPGSPKQLADRLTALGVPLPRTEAGNPSVAEGVLEALRAKEFEGTVGELIKTVLQWRQHNTAIVMFLQPFNELVLHGDGRVRPTIYTLGADTGRMTCVRENLQKLNREGGIRAVIIADPNHLLIGADLAGIELRMAAALSGDEHLKQIILESDERPNDRLDIHWRIARQVFGPDATKADRYTIKPGVFGKLYGGGIPTLAAQMGCSQAVAAAMSETLDWMAPQLAQWSKQVQRSVQRGNTTFETYSGRVIHLDKRLPHKAPNWLIQGSSREVLVDGMLRWQDTQWGERVCVPIHDEILSMVPQEQAQDATKALVECMSCTVLGMPVRAEAAKPSPHWADAS